MVRAALAEGRRRGCGEMLLRAFSEARADLLNALTMLLGSRDDAQDAVQEAFLKCWRKRDQIGGIYNLRAWIFRVGLNSGRDLRRNVWRQRSRPLLGLEPSVERPAPSPADQLVRLEALDRLRTALQQLRPRSARSSCCGRTPTAPTTRSPGCGASRSAPLKRRCGRPCKSCAGCFRRRRSREGRLMIGPVHLSYPQFHQDLRTVA